MKARDLVDRIVAYYKDHHPAGYDRVNNTPVYVSGEHKCAIGCQLPNPEVFETFAKDTGCYGIESLYREAKSYNRQDILLEIQKIIPDDIPHGDGIYFLADLQSVHDRHCRKPYQEFLPAFEIAANNLIHDYFGTEDEDESEGISE